MDTNELLAQLQTELRDFVAKRSEEIKTLGDATRETKDTIQKLVDRINALEVQAAKPAATKEDRSLGSYLTESDALQRLIRKDTKSAVINFPDWTVDQFLAKRLEQKTTITSTAVGSATSGVLVFERSPGIVEEARRRLFIRQLLSSAPTSANAIDFVKINTFSKVVSPQTEASAKGESEMTFTTTNTSVQTIATWIPATRQVLEDMEGLQSVIVNGLTYALEEEIEDQILSGSGTSNNLNGLTTQAQAYDTSLTVASDGWEKIDLIGRAIQQILADKEVAPDYVVLNPNDYWGMRLLKDTTGRYIFDRPDGGVGISPIFGLTPIVTTAMTSGYFLVGSSAPTVSQIRNRAGVQVDISTEHSDYFTKNMVAIRVEARLALVVYRPDALCYGALNTSPS